MTLRLRLICVLTILGACSDQSGPDQEPQARRLSAALVSSSITRPAASNAALVVGNAYVSMVPGTDPDGQRVYVRNLRSGASATAPMRNGGFDPLAVAAETGETLSVTVVHQAGDDSTTYGVVPIWSRPRIVRTSPAGGKTDVPLNSLMLVVFNQPMDSASLSDALHLRHEGVDIPGSVSGELTGGVILNGKFMPTSPLAPGSTYELSVSTTAQSSSGAPLDTAVTVEFTTAASASLARLRVINAVAQVGNMDFFVDDNVMVNELSYLSATDYLELPSGSHDLWTQGSAGWGDFSHASLTGGADYTVIPCCPLFPGTNLLRDDNSEPPAGHARIRIVDYASVSTSVRIYLTSPGADLATATPFRLDIGWASDYFEVPAGDYQIRITPFDSDVVAMDSGTLTLRAGQVRTMVAADAAGGGEPHGFLVLDDRN